MTRSNPPPTDKPPTDNPATGNPPTDLNPTSTDFQLTATDFHSTDFQLTATGSCYQRRPEGDRWRPESAASLTRVDQLLAYLRFTAVALPAGARVVEARVWLPLAGNGDPRSAEPLTVAIAGETSPGRDCHLDRKRQQ